MNIRLLPALGAVVSLASFALPARAAEYTVEPVTGADGKVAACQAVNAQTGVLFMAAGNRVLLFATASKFPFAEGDEVRGTWAMDGGAPAAFTSDGVGAKMVAFDVPNTKETVALLTTGRRLDITADKVKVSFDMAGTGRAFSKLIECVEEAGQ